MHEDDLPDRAKAEAARKTADMRKEMLDLILSTGRFNLCDLLGVGAIKDALASSASSGVTEVSSAVAKMEKVADKTLTKALSVILGD